MSRETNQGQYYRSSGLAFLGQALHRLGLLELCIAVFSFSCTVALSVVQIGLRFIWGKSIWWAQEISLLLMMVAYFIGFSCVFMRRNYVVIHALTNHFSPKIHLYLYYFAQLLAVVFCFVVFVECIRLAPERLTTYTAILHLPEFFWILPLLLASASIILTSLYYFFAVWEVNKQLPGLTIAEIEDIVSIEKEIT